MCIYYKDRKDLSMPINREHIFPAFLGGVNKLPLGYVSDEVNKLFSPLEKKLSVNSIIALLRMMFGPGKRGKKGESSPVVNVGLVEGKVCFYQVINGVAIPCPCILIKRDLSKMDYSQSYGELSIDGNTLILDFIANLDTFKGRYIDKKSENMGCDEILIGYKNGKFFIGHSADTVVDLSEVNKIINYLEKMKFKVEKIITASEAPKIEFNFAENDEYSRVFAKIGFNALAYIMKENYVKQDCFDEIRNYIVGNGKYKYEILPTAENPLRFIKGNFHYCILSCDNNHLLATICLYNSWLRIFDFGEIPNPKYFNTPIGIVCDFENRQEYMLLDFLKKEMY